MGALDAGAQVGAADAAAGRTAASASAQANTARLVLCMDPATRATGKTGAYTLRGWWQAARWPSRCGTSGGSSVVQISVAFGQRVGKRQPGGGDAGLGTSPRSTIRSRRALASGSGPGTAESSASVYGCTGSVLTRSAGPTSTILPRYITAIRSETWRTTERSWATNT